MGGAERCLECFCELFPQADIFTLLHKKGSVSKTIESHKIQTSFLQKFPNWEGYYRYLYPLMPTAVEQFNLSDYDFVISGSACVAKGVLTPPSAIHVAYIYSPMRYAWELHVEYFGEKSSMSWLGRVLIAPQLNYLRVWDVASADRPDAMVADSHYIAKVISKVYRKPAEVIYPPVNTEFFKLSEEPREDYFLMVTAFEPNKRVELAIQAFRELGFPLKIVGNAGRHRDALLKSASTNVTILDDVSDEQLRDLYSRARAFVIPGIDDFGISPLEAMACGTPVIAYAGGGVLETVIPANPKLGEHTQGLATGVFFYQPTSHALVDAVEYFMKLTRRKIWDRKGIRAHAEKFDRELFKKRIKDYVEKVIKDRA